MKTPNQPLQRNAGSRPPSGDSSASETPSSLGPAWLIFGRSAKFKPMRLLFIAVFCWCVTVCEAESYVGRHSKLVPDWTLVLPAIVHGKPYVYAGSAIEIVDIHVNGVAIAAKPGGVARMISSTYPETVDGTAYELSAARFGVSRWKDGKNLGGALLEYSVPCTATKIVIRYVVHAADGASSGIVTMTSYEVNALAR